MPRKKIVDIVENLPRVFNFSGGETSAYMTLKYWRPGDLVIFCDTGREHPKTYKFINDFEAHEGIPVIRIKTSEDPFRTMLIKKKFRALPNRVKRFCTIILKIEACKRYLRSIGIQRFQNFIGFRSDEPKRVLGYVPRFKKVYTKFPLYHDGVDKPTIKDFWSKKEYKLEIPSILGNCTLCFMKGKNAIIAILSVYPELADPWIEDEEQSALAMGGGDGKKHKNSGRRYFPDVTIRQLRDYAQNNLFAGKVDLAALTPAFNCACTT